MSLDSGPKLPAIKCSWSIILEVSGLISQCRGMNDEAESQVACKANCYVLFF